MVLMATNNQPTLRQQWEHELTMLKDQRQQMVYAEINIKRDVLMKERDLKAKKARLRVEIREMEKDLKNTRSYRNRVSSNRRKVDRKIATFWNKKSGWKYRRRQWSANHPGEVMNKVISVS